MSNDTQKFNIVLPKDLVKEADIQADKEYKNRSEVIREALKNYLARSSEGRKFHGLSEQLRESGHLAEALKLNDDAMIAYQQEGDVLGFTENLSSRNIALNHLYQKTGDKKYLILAEHTAHAAVEIAEETKDPKKLTSPLINLGMIQELLGELKEATKTYKKAVENITSNPSPVYNRAAIIADFKVHLETCAYKTGDKSALKRAEEALKEFEKVDSLDDERYEAQGGELKFNQEGSYNYNVWLSGGHMRIAEMLSKDDPKKANYHLQKAKEVIDSDTRLSLRLHQWQKLAQKLKKVA